MSLLRRVLLLVPWLALSACTSDYAVGSVLMDAARRDGAASDNLLHDGRATDAFGSGGTGNGVLLVDATVSASEHENNASAPAEFDVELTVGVSRGGAPVTNASVRIESPGGVVELSHDGSGIYRGQQHEYQRRYTLHVVAGADAVADVQAEGPAIHTLLAPLESLQHPAGQPLTVRWTVPTPASETTLETRELGPLLIPDTGSYDVPGSAFVGTAGQEEDDRVRVRRSEHQTIAGGAVGSRLTIRVRNQVEFKIASN